MADTPNRKGFSVIELLVVIGVMGVLLAIGVPALNGMMRSRNLSRGGITIIDALNIARQAAIARGVNTRFQILQVPDPRDGDPDKRFRMVRIHQLNVDSREWEMIQPARLLPAGIYGDEEPASSTILDPDQLEDENINGQPAKAFSMVFYPDGSTRMDPNAIHSIKLVGKQSDADFLTIHIDPITGHTRIYRP